MTPPPDDIKLTWDDIIVDRLTPAETARWLDNWQWLGLGRIAPIFLSRFGHWFFHRPDGSIHTLDVMGGSVNQVAPDFQQFQASVNTQEWQEQHLYSALILKYRRQGIVAQRRSAIAFAPHPALVQSLDHCTVMVMDMHLWQSICAQTLRQIQRHP